MAVRFFGREIVQVKVAADDFRQIARLQKQGFVLVEGELEFELALATFSENMTACRPADMADLPDLNLLFGSAFPDSRFRSPYFSREDNQRFYRTWIENAVKGKFDDIGLVQCNADGQIQGAVTVRLLAQQQAKIGLLAVKPDCRQQGIGSELLNAAIAWAKQQNAKNRKRFVFIKRLVQALRRCIIGFTLLWKNTMMNNPDFIPFN